MIMMAIRLTLVEDVVLVEMGIWGLRGGHCTGLQARRYFSNIAHCTNYQYYEEIIRTVFHAK